MESDEEIRIRRFERSREFDFSNYGSFNDNRNFHDFSSDED